MLTVVRKHRNRGEYIGHIILCHPFLPYAIGSANAFGVGNHILLLHTLNWFRRFFPIDHVRNVHLQGFISGTEIGEMKGKLFHKSVHNFFREKRRRFRFLIERNHRTGSAGAEERRDHLRGFVNPIANQIPHGENYHYTIFIHSDGLNLQPDSLVLAGQMNRPDGLGGPRPNLV